MVAFYPLRAWSGYREPHSQRNASQSSGMRRMARAGEHAPLACAPPRAPRFGTIPRAPSMNQPRARRSPTRATSCRQLAEHRPDPAGAAEPHPRGRRGHGAGQNRGAERGVFGQVPHRRGHDPGRRGARTAQARCRTGGAQQWQHWHRAGISEMAVKSHLAKCTVSASATAAGAVRPTPLPALLYWVFAKSGSQSSDCV